MRVASFTAVIVSTIANIVLPMGLAAQTGPDTAARQDTLRRYILPAVSVTASSVPAAPGTFGFASSVLTRAELAAELQPFVFGVLATTPSVTVEEGAGPGGPTVVHLRGAGEPYTQMMFDGIPINISGGFNDIAGLVLTNVERVDVARGPLSALWGSSAMAGAVQIVTRPGRRGPPRLDVLLEGGSGSRHGGQGRMEAAVIGGGSRLTYSAGLGAAYHRGFHAVATDMLTRDGSLRLDAALSSRVTVTAVGRVMATRSNLPVRDPGATRAPLDPNQKDSHTRWLGSITAGWRASETWQHRIGASLLLDRFYYGDRQDSLPADSFGVANFDLTFNSRLVRPGFEYVGTGRLLRGASNLTLSVGARWQRESEETEIYEFTYRTIFARANAAGFAELVGGLGSRVSWLLGGRVEKFAHLRAEFLPRAGAAVALVPERLTLRAALGRAFKAPNLSQQYLENPATLPNPNLRPEYSTSWEVGATLTSPGGDLSVGAGYFRQRYAGLIVTVESDVDTTKDTNRNLGSTRASGVELEARHRLSERWRWGGNLAAVRNVVLDNRGLDTTSFPAGGTLPAVPKYSGSAYLSGDVSRALGVMLRATAVGSQTVFSERFRGRRVPTDAHAIVDLAAQWRGMGGWALYARLGNLFNTAHDVAFDRPGRPRTLVLGMRTAP